MLSTTNNDKSQKNTNNSNDISTYVDTEIAALEARREELLAEQERLEAGQVEIEGFEAGQVVKVDLSSLVAAPPAAQKEKLIELLGESPVFEELGGVFRSKEEIKAQMITAGVLPAQAANLGVTQQIRLTGNRVQKSGGGWVRRTARSTWLLPIGFVIILVASWGWLLYSLAGSSGTTGKSNTGSHGTPTMPPTTTTTSFTTTRTSSTTSTLTTTTADQLQAHAQGQGQGHPQGGISYIAARPASQAQTQAQTGVQGTSTAPTSASASPTPPTTQTSDGGNGNGEGGQPYNRVGQPPSEIGGFNGPHGAFLAPSRLAVPALDLDVSVSKAGVQERIIGPVVSAPLTPTTVVTTTPGPGPGPEVEVASPTPSSSPIPTPAIAQVEVQVQWPRPGQVTHYGAYPGELGNCVIFGTQSSLGNLQGLQLNDEIALYDRKNNLFLYRVVAFSATGQPQREIDPTSESWVFEPQGGMSAGLNGPAPDQAQALLTLVVSFPRPLPPVNPELDTPSSSASVGSGPGQGSAVAAKDDFTASRKLAYRAVLVSYAPNAKATPVGTPVGVAGEVWQTQPIFLLPTPTQTPTATQTQTPNVAATVAPISTSTVAPTPAPTQAPAATATAATATAGPGQSGTSNQAYPYPGLPQTGEGGGGTATATPRSGGR